MHQIRGIGRCFSLMYRPESGITNKMPDFIQMSQMLGLYAYNNPLGKFGLSVDIVLWLLAAASPPAWCKQGKGRFHYISQHNNFDFSDNNCLFLSVTSIYVPPFSYIKKRRPLISSVSLIQLAWVNYVMNAPLQIPSWRSSERRQRMNGSPKMWLLSSNLPNMLAIIGYVGRISSRMANKWSDSRHRWLSWGVSSWSLSTVFEQSSFTAVFWEFQCCKREERRLLTV